MVNKRGQGLSTNAIILIVLGVIVLVILAIGFMAGWESFAPWLKNDNNVAEIAQACQIACSTNAKYDYCTSPRELKIEGETLVGVSTTFANGGKYTCNEFSSEDSSLTGVAKCPALQPCGEISQEAKEDLEAEQEETTTQ